ncbi:MAG: DnaB-like helicase C-terminal domain-containing protein [Rhabdochlamydiaceae bacterium]
MKATEIIEKIEQNKKDLEFMKTGFPFVDSFIDGGFLKKELIIIGGHTGIGKSYFGVQILFNIAKQGFKVGYFSLEMSNEMLVARLIGQFANIKPTRIYAGLLEIDEYDRKAEARAKIISFDELMNFHDDLYLLGEIETIIRDNSYEFVVIDFIQNIMLANNMDEYQRLSFVSLQLQRIAKETGCCILVLSQLSNRIAKDGSKIIEYKGSGTIAMVCDLGFFIERSDVQVDGKNEVRLNLKKNRRGISGQLFNFEFQHPGGLIK